MATVEDILMTKGPDVIIAVGDNTVREAARMMAQANVGSVIIMDAQRPSGIFTERDLLRKVVGPGRDPDTTPLRDVMSRPVRSVRLSTEVREAYRILNEEHIRHLAVVEEGSLLGMISARDVLRVEIAQATTREEP